MYGRDAELTQVMWDLCETNAAYSKGIVFGMGHWLGSGLLFSQSTVNSSSEGDDCGSYGYVVIRASSIVRIDRTSKCSFSFKCVSKMQLPVLCAVYVPIHTVESYHLLIGWVMMVLATISDGISDIRLSGDHRIDETYDHLLVYGQIAGFFVGLSIWCYIIIRMATGLDSSILNFARSEQM